MSGQNARIEEVDALSLKSDVQSLKSEKDSTSQGPQSPQATSFGEPSASRSVQAEKEPSKGNSYLKYSNQSPERLRFCLIVLSVAFAVFLVALDRGIIAVAMYI
jgi:hypothetical protein